MTAYTKGSRPALSPGAIEAFTEWLVSRRNRSPKTGLDYTRNLGLLLDWHGGPVPFDELDDVAALWLTTHDKIWSPATSKLRKSAVRSYSKWADGKHTEVLEDYMSPVITHGPPETLPNLLDDVDRLVAHAATPQRAAFFALGGYMGLRCAEALAVTQADIKGRRLEVRGKGNKQRSVPIPSHVVPILAAVDTPHGSLIGASTRTALRWIKDTCAQLGIGDTVSTHYLRRTAATALYRRTNDINMVRDFLGHSDTRVTQLYIGLDWDALAKALERT